VHAQLGSRSSQQAFLRVVARAERSFPGRPFGCGPLSAMFAGCCNVASRARVPEQKKVVRWLDREAARGLREKRRAAIEPHSPVAA
jgi:hypothetical protein